jgi:hypothetical protein
MTLKDRYVGLTNAVNALLRYYAEDAREFWRALSELRAFMDRPDYTDYDVYVELDTSWSYVGSLVSPSWALLLAQELCDAGFTTRIMQLGEQKNLLVPPWNSLEEKLEELIDADSR